MATKNDDGASKRAGPVILKGVANYLHVFKPRYDDDDVKKENGMYQCVLSWSKKDKAQTDMLEDLILDTAINEWGAKAEADYDRGKIHSPIRDGNESDDENFHKCWVTTARRKESLGRPGVVDEEVQQVIDPTEVYSGCEVNLSISMYPYDYKGKKGVGIGMNNLQKLADGERRGGGSRAEDDFKPLSGGRSNRKSRRSSRDDDDDDDRPY